MSNLTVPTDDDYEIPVYRLKNVDFFFNKKVICIMVKVMFNILGKIYGYEKKNKCYCSCF